MGTRVAMEQQRAWDHRRTSAGGRDLRRSCPALEPGAIYRGFRLPGNAKGTTVRAAVDLRDFPQQAPAGCTGLVIRVTADEFSPGVTPSAPTDAATWSHAQIVWSSLLTAFHLIGSRSR